MYIISNDDDYYYHNNCPKIIYVELPYHLENPTLVGALELSQNHSKNRKKEKLPKLPQTRLITARCS